MIEGGYVLHARKIQSSEISYKPPHFREIFNWLYRNANYKDRHRLKRGQLLCTYKEILEGLSWYVGGRKGMYSKSQCQSALKYLKRTTMITTTKTTRGMIVTICNYDYYQDSHNYENHTRTTEKSTREPHENHTLYKKECKNVKNEKNKYSEDGNEIRLAQLLCTLCKNDDPKFKEPNFQKWAGHIDRLMRIDGRTPLEVETVIRWAKDDGFWSSNILSPAKLRKQFQQLKAKMESKKNHSGRQRLANDRDASEYERIVRGPK